MQSYPITRRIEDVRTETVSEAPCQTRAALRATLSTLAASIWPVFASATLLDRHFSDRMLYNGWLRARQSLRVAIWEAEVLEDAQEP